MQVNILLFAAAREAAGCDQITVEVSENCSASEVLAAVGAQIPQLQTLLPSCRLAVDCAYVDADSVINANSADSADSEIALIPPVSGG